MSTFYSFPAGFGEPEPAWAHNLRADIHARRDADDHTVEETALALLNVPAVIVVESAARNNGSELTDSLATAVTAAEDLMAAVIAMNEQLILSYIGFGMGVPQFETDEQMREFFAAMGIELPENMPSPVAFMTTQRFLRESKTLRQRCFSWLFNGYNEETGEISLAFTDVVRHKIRPFKNTLRSLMAACSRDKTVRRALSRIPIARGGSITNSNPELVEPLQDMADIITYEIRQAYEADYYPGIQDVDPLTEEHVERIMVAMQCEVDREQRLTWDDEAGARRNKHTVHLPDLPMERKVALAERRRHWFGVFGITPESWKGGTWSLWKVANVPYPDGYEIRPY